jgi:hypothetical protein
VGIGVLRGGGSVEDGREQRAYSGIVRAWRGVQYAELGRSGKEFDLDCDVPAGWEGNPDNSDVRIAFQEAAEKGLGK